MKLAHIPLPEPKSTNALTYLLDAWDEAIRNGVKRDAMATAALFTALSSLIDQHGEDAVAALAERLVARIRRGEFTLGRAAH